MAWDACDPFNVKDPQRRNFGPLRECLWRDAKLQCKGIAGFHRRDCPFQTMIFVSHTKLKPCLRQKVKHRFVYMLKPSFIIMKWFRNSR